MFVWILDCIRSQRWPAAAGLTRPAATTPLVYAITAPLSACHVSVSVSVHQFKENTIQQQSLSPHRSQGGWVGERRGDGAEAPVTQKLVRVAVAARQ